MTTPTTPQTGPAPVFPGERTAAEQAMIDRHRHLTQALARLDAATCGDGADEAVVVRLIAHVGVVARAAATATQPLIDHLPAITAALGDAADYRGGDGGWCHDCAASDSLCGDHQQDQAMAAAYQNALHALTR